MSATNPPTDREKLAELLERFGGSIGSFDQLRSDSYEQVLAAQSLERLEHLYTELFRAGQSTEATAKTAPPWPPGTRWAGEQPSRWLLDKILERFNTERDISSLVPISRFLDDARAKAQVLPIGKQQQTLDAIITFVGQELIAAKMKGQSIISNLDAVDRLQTQEVIRQKNEQLADSRTKTDLAIRKYEDYKADVADKKKKLEAALQKGSKDGAITPEAYAHIEEMLNLL